MTKSFDMVVLIENFERGSESAIMQAVEGQWDPECAIEAWSDQGDGVLEAYGCCSLYADDRPADFASRLAESTWKANDGYCDVALFVVHPSLWAEHHAIYRTTFTDYKRWLSTKELPYLEERQEASAPLARAA